MAYSHSVVTGGSWCLSSVILYKHCENVALFNKRFIYVYAIQSGKAKQINILGSRQHPAEKVALWCEFLFFYFFKHGQIAGYSYVYKYVFNGV